MDARWCRLNILTIDFETYYDKQYSLSKLTTEEYLRHDDFEVIGVAVKQSGGETQWFSGTKQKTKEFLDSFDWGSSLAVAHNAMFDMAILSWHFNIKPKIGVTGLNPHCESILEFNEDKKIITPIIKSMKKKGISCYGPYSADTIFLNQNRKKFDVILGMYHDQVLAPLKTLFEYDAINITMGLSFLRVSPDHGPNERMINKNLSNPTSLSRALEFLDKN